MGDAWMGDDFFHQGAFRQTQGVAWSMLVGPDPKGFSFLDIPDYDHYDFYLRFPTLDSLAKATGVANFPVWRSFVEHPSWDSYWQAKALPAVMKRARGADAVGGGDMGRGGHSRAAAHLRRAGEGRHEAVESHRARPLVPQRVEPARRRLARPDPLRQQHRRLVSRECPASLVRLVPARQGRRERSPRPGSSRQARTSGTPSTPGRRRTSSRASSTCAQTASFRSTRRRPGQGSTTPIISDPAHPVPYIPRPDDDSGWDTWLVQSQRFVDNRPDVATWVSEPLTEDLTIAGDVIAHLFASTTGTDADWVVKLIDVYPDSVADRPAMGGYQLMVNADIMRGRYWKGFSKAVADPGQHRHAIQRRPAPAAVSLPEGPPAHGAGAEHLVPALRSQPADLRRPTSSRRSHPTSRRRLHRIWHTPRYPSHLSVSVLP